jgi:AcrR family transcriptional regulator
MGIAERREQERAAVRTKVMDAARRVFAVVGYDRASLRQIAESIDYSTTAIYVHFRDKADLLTQLMRSDFMLLAEQCRKLASVKDPIERVRKIGRVYIKFAVEHPHHYRLMFQSPASDKAACVDADEAGRGNPDVDAYAMLKATVQEAIDAGRLVESDAELVAQTFWAGVHGVASLAIDKEGDAWVNFRSLEARTKLMLDALLAGLTKPTRGHK